MSGPCWVPGADIKALRSDWVTWKVVCIGTSVLEVGHVLPALWWAGDLR